MWEPKKKKLLLWLPILWFILSSFWLRRLKKLHQIKAFNARQKLIIQGNKPSIYEDLSENESPHISNSNMFDSQEKEENIRPLLITMVLYLRKISIWLWVIHLISIEISDLYCDGHTGIVFFIIKKLTRFCFLSLVLYTKQIF